MGELDPTRKKSEEQFPLLKVVSEGAPAAGDDVYRVRAPRSWIARCSEYISACWMTLMLLMIAMLGVYSLGVAVSKRQSIFAKYIHEKYHQRRMHHHIGEPASGVFLHKIVSIDESNPFDHYDAFLSDMALKYPNLRFNVFFLDDDRFVKKPIQSYHNKIQYPTDKPPDDVTRFMVIHPNVNITRTRLSKYMDQTRINRWRIIPIQTIPFYCGVHSVWKNGGIYLDLEAIDEGFKSSYNQLDKRIMMILDHHNNGLGVKKEELDTIESAQHDEDEVMFSATINSIWSSLRARLFHNIVETTESPVEKQEVLVRKHRNKREVLTESMSAMSINISDLPKKPDMRMNQTTVIAKHSDVSTDASPSNVNIDLIKTTQNDESKKTMQLSFLKKPEIPKRAPLAPIFFFDISFDLDDEPFPFPNMWPFIDNRRETRELGDGKLTKPLIMEPPRPLSEPPHPLSEPTRPLWEPLRPLWEPLRPLSEPTRPLWELPRPLWEPPRPLSEPKRPLWEPTRPLWDSRRKFGPVKPQPSDIQSNGLVVLEVEGKFISSLVHYHFFLGRLISQIGLNPRRIFENALTTDCYDPIKQPSYCAELYFL